ncbi:hypothetical protein FB451DRAFT_1191388 [Mycena latifolia]|nr:hypothetical protein FB451DRAFT_1191388 [Mycena latifolia]
MAHVQIKHDGRQLIFSPPSSLPRFWCHKPKIRASRHTFLLKSFGSVFTDSAVHSRIWYHKLRAQQFTGVAALENGSLKHRPCACHGQRQDKGEKIMLTRNALAKHLTSPWFEKIDTGAGCATSLAQPGQVFELKYGNVEKLWQMDRTSNTTWTDDKFNRLVGTHTNEKRVQMDISDMLAHKRQLAGQRTAAPLGAAERSRLITQRRHDYNKVGTIDAQLEDRLARVNEWQNRKEAGGVVDPSAWMRTVPRLFESVMPTSRPGTPNPVTLGVAPPPPKKGLSPSPAKTNGKAFEAAIIDSIEVLPVSYKNSSLSVQTKTGSVLM